eukprot:2282279-Pyramimonas_sp.AAC.1
MQWSSKLVRELPVYLNARLRVHAASPKCRILPAPWASGILLLESPPSSVGVWNPPPRTNSDRRRLQFCASLKPNSACT